MPVITDPVICGIAAVGSSGLIGGAALLQFRQHIPRQSHTLLLALMEDQNFCASVVNAGRWVINTTVAPRFCNATIACIKA